VVYIFRDLGRSLIFKVHLRPVFRSKKVNSFKNELIKKIDINIYLD